MKAITARTAAEPLPVWSGRNKPRNWLLVGLFASLTVHALLCIFFYRTDFQPATPLGLQKQPPPTFKVTSVDPNPKPLDQTAAAEAAEAAKPNPDKTNVQLPADQKSFDKLLQEVHATAAMPDDTRDVLPDKPKVERTNLNSVINEIEKTQAQTLARDPNAPRSQSALNNVADSGRPQPAMTGTELATSTTIKHPNSFNGLPGDSAGPRTDRAPGFSDLESLLSQKGPLGSGTKFKMPNNQLFAYDSAELQGTAVDQLQKVATLIKRNPNATFTLEGYTDSYGSDDYNLDLSKRRAEAVKAYLVDSLGINPAQIETRGYGKANLLTSPDASIDEQEVNRRVVVVVH
ncbi:MAG TPA: OmpA family protein [Chthoniobacterales bacterium]|jgi:outer membrane protein OmpA-like peptidoglycan-associated protein